jgi:hypothetical protein
LANEAPYLCNDHHEKVKKLTFIGYLCEICSMCENIVICVKI